MTNPARLDRTLAALADPHRRQVIDLLRERPRPAGDLAREIVPSLTGLSMERLTDLGYAVIDEDTDRTCVYVPPADVSNGHV